MNKIILFLPLLMLIINPSTILAETKNYQCSADGDWCYRFLDAKVSRPIVELGNMIEVKTKIQQLLESDAVYGQVEVHLTILDPDNLKHVKSVTKFINRGEITDVNFTFSPKKIGSHEMVLEITPPRKCCGHVFDMRDLEFGVVKEPVIPEWVRNNADWWANGQISDDTYTDGMQFLIAEGIIAIPETKITPEETKTISEWVRNNADWWSRDLISNYEFTKGLQVLISNGVIKIS